MTGHDLGTDPKSPVREIGDRSEINRAEIGDGSSGESDSRRSAPVRGCSRGFQVALIRLRLGD